MEVDNAELGSADEGDNLGVMPENGQGQAPAPPAIAKKKIQSEEYQQVVRDKLASGEYVAVPNSNVGNNPAPCWAMLDIVKLKVDDSNNNKELPDTGFAI